MLYRLLPEKNLFLCVALLTAALLLPTLASSASAGCLREWQDCGECATKAFWRAMGRLDPGGAMDAYVDAVDCDIDLFHCVVLAVHHNYVCAV